MTTPTLPDFLLARVAETEAMFAAAVDDIEYHGSRMIDARALVAADAEAKRQIIEVHGSQVTTEVTPYWSPEVRLLAAMYADHPDYRDEWRP